MLKALKQVGKVDFGRIIQSCIDVNSLCPSQVPQIIEGTKKNTWEMLNCIQQPIKQAGKPLNINGDLFLNRKKTP